MRKPNAMRTRIAIVLTLLVAQTAVDAFSALAAAGCLGSAAPKAGSCCCGPSTCETPQPSGNGITGTCCTMRLPVRDQAPTAPAREATPLPAVATLDGSPAVPAGALAAPVSSWVREPRLNDPAPPLYDLLRAYRN